MKRAAITALAAAALAGCGYASGGSPATAQSPAPAQSCAYQAMSADQALMTVQATGMDCGQLLQALATGGQVWTVSSDPAAPYTAQFGTYPAVTVCSLVNGGSTITVRQAGSTGVYMESQDICSADEQAGWTPEG